MGTIFDESVLIEGRLYLFRFVVLCASGVYVQGDVVELDLYYSAANMARFCSSNFFEIVGAVLID